MNWNCVSVKTAASIKPLTLAEIREHLNLETADATDSYLTMLLDAAIARVDGGADGIGYAMLRQSWLLTMDDFGWERPITLLGWPVVGVTSIKYSDAGGMERTLPSSSYKVITTRTIAQAFPVGTDGTLDNWPSGLGVRPGHVQVEYTLGAASAGDVPADIRIALLMMIGKWYMAREGLVSQSLSEIDGGVVGLLNKYRWGFAA